MIKILFFFIFQVFIISAINVNSIKHKYFSAISHAGLPLGLQTNKQRKFSYIDLRKDKREDSKGNLLSVNKNSKNNSSLQNVSFLGFMGITGLSVPIIYASLMVYNKLINNNKNLSDSEKILGKYLYKHDNSIVAKNIYDNDKSFNIFYIITNIYYNLLAYVNFYINAKKIKTKKNVNDYTILFFHSYNVDKFLQSRNIKTYVDRLKETYKLINKNNNVNIIYVPLDNKILFNIKHFGLMNNWYSVIFNDKQQVLKLIKNYNIMNIPTMVLLDKNMNVINDNINYLLLYNSKDFPYKNINSLTYINNIYDKNNNQHNFKKLDSDYVIFYFNNDKENKEDIETLIKIKNQLSKNNIKLDIIFIKDIQRKPEKTNFSQGNSSDVENNNKTNDEIKNEENYGENEQKKLENSEENEKKSYMNEIYHLGKEENNSIYKLLLYDTFDVTFKPISILVNKKGKILNKYINVNKKNNDISDFILNNHKSLKEKVNEHNYIYKYDNISNLNNLNVFAPIFILFLDKLDFNLLNTYNELIEIYNQNRKGKKINFYLVLNDDKKYEALKNLCSVNNTTQVAILDLFNQKLFKESVNNINIIQNVDGKYNINKDNFFKFLNNFYSDDLYSSPIVLTKPSL
ncbi:thioredoxin-like protein, putative [Plasmodium berghei]|uniref:Thioredoxin-like protein, putative n=2 Tax=Plasmodium berghei TaxID=5821 RepID=A0A509AL21_PLABA|nr:thioredoxin-like protein, putative [Plasmodium berghei ANKA]CXI53699.1 thioredoxin-like protein, putative [Plasmodium berghei]SCL94842.1 thioredoxin-like protein, putative [Plasmodium berghei]SCM16115.1 thioredoxin-like protein, putative [Plasmodium berghei]SCM17911.1 thioredoxin-like protein, putative [Plasmodium berghei]SCN26249.1 thioredoxin-like protein, putative [Plasmodium berghei]|eukprot:XP_034422039.1 thioredoxin-like protein, putative [Plasmodium berghei ANKA]